MNSQSRSKTKVTSVLVNQPGNGLLVRSIQRLANTLPAEFSIVGDNGSESNAQIALLITNGEDDFFDNLEELIKSNVKSFVLLWPFGHEEAPWNELPPAYAEAFAQMCLISKPDRAAVFEALEKAENRAANSPSEVWKDRCLRVIAARNLYKRGAPLSLFSHNGKYDLTNSFLAPARMLILAGQSQLDISQDQWWTKAWFLYKKFGNTVCGAGMGRHGVLQEEIAKAWENVGLTEQCRNLGELDLSAIEQLMDILTEVRVLAGKRAISPSVFRHRAGNIAEAKASQADSYRILVVEDHYAAWRPVVDVLIKLLEQRGFTIRLDYSVDGATVGDRNLLQCIPDYDLILLDVFIGKVSGIQLLKQIREWFLHIPVLIWTTSRDINLPAEASLANGFIFKKTSSCEVISNLIAAWLEEARAKRVVSLLSPFFDQNIKNVQMRESLRDFSKWALQQLDGFHALAPAYFLYFTDHGGRHITELFGILEKFVRPLAADGKLFSDDLGARTEEICALYLAVLCHEMGMFPIGGESNFHKASAKKIDRVRKLHSLRGMMLFASPQLRHDDLKKLIDDLAKCDHKQYVLSALALLVGYHARALKSFAIPFCELDRSARDRIKECRFKGVTELEVSSALDRLKNDVSESGKNEHRLEKLRKQCAVLRFADAIDLDRTRLPADFIKLRKGRNAVNNIEYLKRQLVAQVSFEQKVTLKFDCPRPDEEQMAAVLEIKRKVLGQLLNPPWDTKAVHGFETVKKAADKRLEMFWQVAMKGPEAGTLDAGKDARIRGLGFDGDKISVQVLRTLMAVTSLAVLCEIQEEYQAIIDCDLTTYVQMGKPEWKDEAAPLSASVTILTEGLRQYHWKVEG